MRLRNIPGAKEKIEECPFTVQNPEALKGVWKKTLFQNDHPLEVEIGMGKGQFITALAQRDFNTNFVGIEKFSSVLLRAVEKRELLEEIQNLYYIRFDAEEIMNIFAPNEVDKIYLNFSDPWPKDRHHKRRLTSREFLARYEQILKPDGIIEFKTDNRGLFDFSIEEAKASNWEILACTYDLHKDQVLNEGNIMTEYEEKFSILGNKINKLILKRP